MGSRPQRAAGFLVIVLAAGVALGALGRLSDYAPIPLRAAFNLGVPWLIVAAAAGALVRRLGVGMIVGAGLLVTAMVSYYAILLLVERRGGGGYAQTMALSWGAVGLLGGAVFGLAGAAARRRPGFARTLAVALAAGALAGEGLWLLASRAYVLAPSVVALEVLAGALLPLTLVRRPVHFGVGLILTAGLAVVGMAGAEIVRELVWAQGWRGR